MRINRFDIFTLILLVLSVTGCSASRSASDSDSDATSSSAATDLTSDITMDRDNGFQAGDIREINIPGTEISFQLTYVPEGTRAVGTAPEEDGMELDEGPQASVSLGAYWIGRFEVTDDEYGVFRYQDRDADTTAVEGAVYQVDGVTRPSPPYEDPAFGMGGASKPAVGMTQWGALQYAKWLTQKTGVFFRLPTEAEWETACRAGQSGAFSFGDDIAQLGEYAWTIENSGGRLQSVGQKRPNVWQIHDMQGNASEWMLDEYEESYHDLIGDMGADPWIQPTRLHPRTVRGGAFDDPPEMARCGSRLESTTNWKRRDPQIPKSYWWNTDSPFLGFRIVAPVTAPSEEEISAFWSLVLGE
ncbi:MAG: SUMF1/EgtB/PvdO family nonheme iron enzyme [Bacteroidetes bacterium]|nr:SUMF1/EgtB/PvdO family nonheme iron enzyme [Bacteroidota bacterium]